MEKARKRWRGREEWRGMLVANVCVAMGLESLNNATITHGRSQRGWVSGLSAKFELAGPLSAPATACFSGESKSNAPESRA